MRKSLRAALYASAAMAAAFVAFLAAPGYFYHA
jgi:hypothetical protein